MRKVMISLMVMLVGATVFADYTVDADTLHLYHFAADGSDSVTTDPLDLEFGGDTAIASVIGGTLYTYDGIVNNSTTGHGPYAGILTPKTTISQLVGADGAFTFEALVKPLMASDSIPTHMEIISLDDEDANTTRGFQFRINSDGTTLRFQSLATNPIWAFDATISYAADTWYHAAVTYNGSEGSPDNLKLYWTEVGSAVPVEVGSFTAAADLVSTVDGKFCVGNALRAKYASSRYVENFEGNIDDVRISSLDRYSYVAQRPTPAHGEVTVPVDQVFSWIAPNDPNVTATTVYDVYMDPNETDVTNLDPSVRVSTDQAGLIYDPTSDLDFDTTYYWCVVATNQLAAGGTKDFAGPVWTFDSQTSNPEITGQPVDIEIFPADPAVFTCEFTSVAAPTVTWYMVGETEDTELADDADYDMSVTNVADAYTATLEILSPTAADEGMYYCVIDNGSPVTPASDAVSLLIKSLLAQYDFDGALAPAAGSASDAPTGQGKSVDGIADANSLEAVDVTLSYTTGVDGGQAVMLDQNEYVDFGVEGYPKTNALGGPVKGTIVFWVKPVSEGIVLSNFNDGAKSGFYAGRIYTASEEPMVGAYLRGETAVLVNAQTTHGRPDWDVFDGDWHMMAFTWEVGNSAKIYIDGELTYSASPANISTLAAWQRGVLLGATRTSERHLLSDLLKGAVDNLRIYNYQLDADNADVFAQEYYDITGTAPCGNAAFVGSEYNLDNTGSSYCRVDLVDFAEFASAWLSDGFWDAP